MRFHKVSSVSKDSQEEQWAIRRAFRRFVKPEDAHFWAHAIAIAFSLGITFLMIFFVLWRIRRSIYVSPSAP